MDDQRRAPDHTRRYADLGPPKITLLMNAVQFQLSVEPGTSLLISAALGQCRLRGAVRPVTRVRNDRDWVQTVAGGFGECRRPWNQNGTTGAWALAPMSVSCWWIWYAR